ncbi:MAG TPA: DUF503 domain-containing protein [Anaerolineales bacterium]|jgi:hypothetical protein|nr:DUF503 domain-containing protein [Anaerolineales bacterium]
MIIGACVIELRLPAARSLKQKRGQLQSLLTRLRREFNLAVAEIGHNDVWQSAQIAMVAVSNERAAAEKALRRAVLWIEKHRPDLDVVAAEIEWR